MKRPNRVEAALDVLLWRAACWLAERRLINLRRKSRNLNGGWTNGASGMVYGGIYGGSRVWAWVGKSED